MKKEEKFDIIKFLIVLGIGMMILSIFCRCTTTKVVPITEYRDRYINKDRHLYAYRLCMAT